MLPQAAEKRNFSPTPSDAENGPDQDFRGASGPHKRARRNAAFPTIEYNDVYRDGHPDNMCKIIYYPPSSKPHPRIEPGWFIIRCLTCTPTKHFGSNGRDPLRSAAKHINGVKHGRMQKSHDNAIEILGCRVLNCDAAKAEKNNAMLPQTRDPEPRTDNASHHESLDVPQPKVGTPYITRDRGRDWVVMVLPLGGYFADLGVQGCFNDALARNPPRCFERSHDGSPVFVDGTLQWADGYKDGQPQASERQYPVRFFNDPKKEPAPLKWVRARELRSCNLDDPKTPKISGSFVARTHYAMLPSWREEAWSYVNRRVDGQSRHPIYAPHTINDDADLGFHDSPRRHGARATS